MATTGEEIKIDLDELDAKKAEKPDKGAKKPPDEAVKAAPVVEPAKKDDKPLVTADEGLEKLKKQLDDERARADANEQRARTAEADSARAKIEVKGSQLETVKSTLSALTTANDALDKQAADLMAAGDFPGAQKLNREVAKNEAKILQLENAKTMLEKQAKETSTTAGDPVEELAAQLTPRSAAWVRAHPEFARDNRKYTQMLAAHNLVTGYGVKADTDEYFSEIEKALRIEAPAPKATNGSGEHQEVVLDDPMSDAARPTKKAAPASAPVSRSGNATGNNRANVVTLSPEEIEIAKLNNQTPEEYARAKVALKKEGRLN
jgi:hypothetical protein